MQERHSVSFRRLSWVAALLTALAAAGAYVAYAQLLQYRRSVAEHLPPNTVFVARLDVEKVTLFEPVRRHLLPLVEALPPARAPQHPAQSQTRLARLRAAGLNLGLDLREVLVATTADHGWLLALGGLFPETGALGSIERVLREENAGGWQRVADRLDFSPSGAALAQAADGSLLLASDRATLEAALPPSAHHLSLGLAREGAGGAALTPEAAAAWSYPGPLDSMGGVQRVLAKVQLSSEVELEVAVELSSSAQAQRLATFARHWASTDAVTQPDQRADMTDPTGLWARTRAVEVNETSVKLLSSWRSSELDRSARELAAWVRRLLPAAERAGS